MLSPEQEKLAISSAAHPIISGANNKVDNINVKEWKLIPYSPTLVKKEMQETKRLPPTIVEFKIALKKLKENKLTGLNLSKIKLSPEQIQALACLLETNTSLISLNLRGCKIGNTGAEKLARALVGNKTLRFLNLEKNDISNIQKIAWLLTINTALQWLNLKENPISIISLDDLNGSLSKNISLVELELSDKILPYDRVYELKSTLRERQPDQYYMLGLLPILQEFIPVTVIAQLIFQYAAIDINAGKLGDEKFRSQQKMVRKEIVTFIDRVGTQVENYRKDASFFSQGINDKIQAIILAKKNLENHLRDGTFESLMDAINWGGEKSLATALSKPRWKKKSSVLEELIEKNNEKLKLERALDAISDPSLDSDSDSDSDEDRYIISM